ncbi:MAG: hypothetical protein JWQ40_1733 [Segetibacter sp.]|jgi:hypothetical protein|nr:hypothetical protein [Segetibacter sp.]
MEASPFFIEFLYKDKSELAEVKPCCQTDNVFYYDVSIRNKYQFTVTPTIDEEMGMTWKISLKNADNQVEPELIEIIGNEIEKHLM